MGNAEKRLRCNGMTCTTAVMIFFALQRHLYVKILLCPIHIVRFITPSVAFYSAAISNVRKFRQNIIYSWKENWVFCRRLQNIPSELHGGFDFVSCVILEMWSSSGCRLGGTLKSFCGLYYESTETNPDVRSGGGGVCLTCLMRSTTWT